ARPDASVRSKRSKRPEGSERSERLNLENDPEAQLQSPRRVCEVRTRIRQPVARAAFLHRVRTVVRPVEQVEHFRDQVAATTAPELDRLLEPHVDAVYRLADEVVARNNRSVQP